jgi:hypothetical protein
MDILSSVLGAVIAGIIGIFTVSLQERKRLSKLREVLILGISDDLKKTLVIFDQIENEWDKTQQIWAFTLNEIKNSRSVYDRNRDYTLLIENENLRESLVDYYFKSSQLLDMITWQISVITGADARYRSIKALLKIQNPELEETTMDCLAAMQAQSEFVYYQEVLNDIVSQKNKLTSLKSKIENLRRDLAGLKTKKFF